MITGVCLPKISRADGFETFLSGHKFPATRVASIGLISRAVPRAQLGAEIDAIRDDVLRGGPTAMAAAKSLVNQVPTMSEEDAMRWTAELVGELFTSQEAAEGMSAFLERRSRTWSAGRRGGAR